MHLEFDFPETKNKNMKRTNPSTSHEAYDKLKKTDQVAIHHSKIIAALEAIKEGNYESIANAANLDKTQIGRRLCEMERDQKIRKTDKKTLTSTGRNAFVYTIQNPTK